jgi:hypothetical protein
MTQDNIIQEDLGFFSKKTNGNNETNAKKDNQEVEQQITDSVTTSNPIESKDQQDLKTTKTQSTDFEKRFNDTRKAYQKTKNKTLYANGQLSKIESDILAIKDFLGGADIDDDDIKTKFDSIISEISEGKRILTTDDIDLSDVEDIAKKIIEEAEVTEEEKALREIDSRIKAKIDDYAEFKKDNELKDKIDAFYILFNKSSEKKQKEYLTILKSNNIADILDFMSEEGEDYIKNVVTPIKKHGNSTQFINSLNKTIEELKKENETLKQELENRGTSKITSLKTASINSTNSKTSNSNMLGWFGK